MASRIVSQATKQVKPILSMDKAEARRRVLNLYRAWYRQIPYIVLNYDIPVTEDMCRQKLREHFLKNKHVSDIRSIDVLVLKGQQDLVETVNIWKQKTHIMKFFGDSLNPRPTDFLSKFYTGQKS